MVNRTLDIDKGRVPFVMLKTELNIETTMSLPDGYDVQLKGFIDRLDLEGNNINIIDYKSGSAKIDFDKVEKLFMPHKERKKQVFQLLFYVLLMKNAIEDNTGGNIKNPQIASLLKSIGIENSSHNKAFVPGLYAFENYFLNKFEWQVRKKTRTVTELISIESENEIFDEYKAKLEECISSIFDKDIPFTQTEDRDTCEYCPYTNICRR